MATYVSSLVCEYKKNPIGTDVKKPRLSWKIKSDERDLMQKAYQVQVTLSRASLEMW